MNIKEGAEPVQSSDFYYDIFDGGTIDPSELLVAEDATRVKEGIDIISKFYATLENTDLLEEM